MSTPQTNFIGIYVSGIQARAALVDSQGTLIDSRVAEVAPKELIQQLAAMVEELRGGKASVGAIGVAIPAGTQGIIELDVVAPGVATETPISTELALIDGDNRVGTVELAVTVTPDGRELTSTDADDQFDGEVSGGCAAGHGPGWLALAPVLLVLRRRRRS